VKAEAKGSKGWAGIERSKGWGKCVRAACMTNNQIDTDNP